MKKNQIAIEKKESSKLEKINLDKFAKELENVNLKEKKERSTIYVYPEGFSKSEINSEKGKAFRNKLRNQRNRHCNNVLSFSKSKDFEKLENEISAFKSFYKSNYQLNDFSIDSISQSKNDEKIKDLSLMLSIIKEIGI